MPAVGVPHIAQRINRLSSIGVTSGMASVAGSSALASVGFTQVSEVMGAATMRAPVSGFFSGGGVGVSNYPRGWQGYGTVAPPVYTSSRAARVPSRVAAATKLNQLALNRLRTEIRAVGGDGAVDVHLEHTVVEAGATQSVWRCLATGTAVRSMGSTRAARAFTTSMSAGETAAALLSGWIPLTVLVCPVMAVRWVEPASRAQERARASNGEIVAFTDAVNACRRQAALDFAREARAVGADGAVMDDMRLDVGDAPDLAEVHVVLTGSALARFGSPANPAPLAILSLADVR